ncbi:hypothetical protein CR513_11577, partial [Mucuna pruriens]
MILDGGSCTTVASTILVEKINFNIGEVKVDKKVSVSFAIENYKDEVLCDRQDTYFWAAHDNLTERIESALLIKEKLLALFYEDVYFTNKFHSSFPCEEFIDVFLDEMPHRLPPLRGIKHQIDLILGCPIPNRLAYITNHEEIKEIQKQVNELLQK